MSAGTDVFDERADRSYNLLPLVLIQGPGKIQPFVILGAFLLFNDEAVNIPIKFRAISDKSYAHALATQTR